MATPISRDLINELKETLPGVKILTPDSPHFAHFNVRWSKLWEKNAVCDSTFLLFIKTIMTINRE
jgi:hypothetical protein